LSAVQDSPKRATGRKLHDDAQLVWCDGGAHEEHYMRVAQLDEQLHLTHEVSCGLVAAAHALHGYIRALIHSAHNLAECASSDFLAHDELIQRDLPVCACRGWRRAVHALRLLLLQLLLRWLLHASSEHAGRLRGWSSWSLLCHPEWTRRVPPVLLERHRWLHRWNKRCSGCDGDRRC